MGNKLYVGSLPFSVTSEELGQIFGAHGNVVSARVITDKFSGRSKGFGFVEFETDEAANAALQTLNNHELQGRKIMVSEAHPQAPRENRPGGGGGGGPRRGGGGRPGGGGFGRDRGPRGGGGDRGSRY